MKLVQALHIFNLRIKKRTLLTHPNSPLPQQYILKQLYQIILPVKQLMQLYIQMVHPAPVLLQEVKFP